MKALLVVQHSALCNAIHSDSRFSSLCEQFPDSVVDVDLTNPPKPNWGSGYYVVKENDQLKELISDWDSSD